MNIISLNKGLQADPENQTSFFIPPLPQNSMANNRIYNIQN